jgi:hypothetical protein
VTTQNPTDEDMARDGGADLAACDKGKQATFQAWVAFEKKVPRQWQQAFQPVVMFARSALDALPAWIRRALYAEHVLAGEQKANALWAKGMESQCEVMDGLKQELRKAQARVAELETVAAAVIESRDALERNVGTRPPTPEVAR